MIVALRHKRPHGLDQHVRFAKDYKRGVDPGVDTVHGFRWRLHLDEIGEGGCVGRPELMRAAPAYSVWHLGGNGESRRERSRW